MYKLAEQIGILLKQNNYTLSIAESCTGGLLSKIITDVPGSSSYFKLGLVTYSNESKINLLKVPPEIINTFGAVSSQTAIAMAKGLKDLSKTDISISITGIAGPSSDNTNKPIGLVYIGICFKDKIFCQKKLFKDSGRIKNRQKSVKSALLLLKKYITLI